MLADPAGGQIGLAHILPQLPVPDFILPGLFLLVGMGIAPLVLIYGLMARPRWAHRAWTGTLILGFTLAIWLIFQGFLIGFNEPIQHVTAIDGALIILLALTPGVRKHFAR